MPAYLSLYFSLFSLAVSPDSTSWLTSYNDDATAYINVCKPVGSDTGCDPTAAVCIKSNNQSHTVSAMGFSLRLLSEFEDDIC